jgi:hypothetical protein
MPAVVISVEAPRVDNAILVDYVTSVVSREEPEIRSNDPIILTENNSMDEQLHFVMTGGSRDWEDEGDEGDMCDAIRTASR